MTRVVVYAGGFFAFLAGKSWQLTPRDPQPHCYRQHSARSVADGAAPRVLLCNAARICFAIAKGRAQSILHWKETFAD
jgi:hypothetical protein